MKYVKIRVSALPLTDLVNENKKGIHIFKNPSILELRTLTYRDPIIRLVFDTKEKNTYAWEGFYPHKSVGYALAEKGLIKDSFVPFGKKLPRSRFILGIAKLIGSRLRLLEIYSNPAKKEAVDKLELGWLDKYGINKNDFIEVLSVP